MANRIQHPIEFVNQANGFALGGLGASQPREVDCHQSPIRHPMQMTALLRLEDQLLLGVARGRMANGQSENVRSLLRADLDWEYLIAAADRHSLLPLLHSRLSAVANEVVPQSVLRRLRDGSQESSARNLFLAGELIKLLDCFNEHGVRAIPFKGPTLAFSAYGDVGMRQFGDLDILVHKQDVVRTKKVLMNRGFNPRPKLTKAQEAALLHFDSAYNFDNGQGVVVDVHWDFAPRYFSVELDTSQLWNRVAPIKLAGRELLTLADEDLLLILCLHGFTHLWERLGWICDVANLIDRRTALDWDLLLQNAKSSGCRRILSLGLLLASDLLGARVPERVWTALLPDRAVRNLAGKIQPGLFAQPNGSMGFVEGASLHLRMRERKSDRLKSGLRWTITPRSNDWMFLPLPDWLFFLYYPLRPFRLAGQYGARLLRHSR